MDVCMCLCTHWGMCEKTWEHMRRRAREARETENRYESALTPGPQSGWWNYLRCWILFWIEPTVRWLLDTHDWTTSNHMQTHTHTHTPFGGTYGEHSWERERKKKKRPNLTRFWEEKIWRVGEGKKKKKKQESGEIVGGREKLKAEKLRGREGGKREKQAPDELKREEGDMYMKKEKWKRHFGMKREARTSSEEGEIECSLFEWLSDSRLWLLLPLVLPSLCVSLLTYRSGTAADWRECGVI